MKLKIKKLFIVMLIISILFPMLFSNISKADDNFTVERAGNYAATFAINFYNNWSSVSYISNGNSENTSNVTISSVVKAGQQIFDTILLGNSNISYIATSGRDSEKIVNNVRYSEINGMDCTTFVSAALWLAGYEQFSSTMSSLDMRDKCANGEFAQYGFDLYKTDGVKVYKWNENTSSYVLIPNTKPFDVLQVGDVIVVRGPSSGHANIVKELTGNTNDKYLALDCGNEKNWQNETYYNSQGGGLKWDCWTDNNKEVWDYYGCTEAYLMRAVKGNSTLGNINSSTVKRGEIKTEYDDTADEIATPVQAGDDKYKFSNKSWIDFVFKNSLDLDENYYPAQNTNLGSNYYKEIGSDFIDEENSIETKVVDISEMMNTGKLLPGDILYTTQEEYLVYVGGTKVIYAQQPQIEEMGALKYEYLQSYFTKVKNRLLSENIDNEDYELPVYGITNVYRLTENLISVANIKEDTENLFFNGKGYYDINIEYSGMPIQGTYEGTNNFNLLTWIIEAIIDVFKFLVNLIFYCIKAVILGWVNIIESFIQSTALALSGHTSKVTFIDKFTGVSATSYAGESVTVESLFFNKLPITDANFFNFETAGGYSLIDESGNPTVLYLLRQSLAGWYIIIRNLSIAILLFILIYTGIRMAITTISEKKAECKKRLIDWLVALVIIFFLHFFMYLVFFINDKLVIFFDELSSILAENIIGANGFSLYDAVKTKAYAFDFMEGLPAAVLYIILVYLFIRFFLVYLKRTFAVYILAMMGSLMGVKYAYNKANGNKTDPLKSWMKEFAFNVLIQSIHCLIYTVFMTAALAASSTSIIGVIIAIVVLQFMLEADKIFMKIFGIKGGILEDVDKPESYWTILTKAMVAKRAVDFTWGTGKKILSTGYGAGKYVASAVTGLEMKDINKKIDLAKYKLYGLGAVTINRLPIRRIRNSKYLEMVRKLNNKNVGYETKRQIYNTISKARLAKKRKFTRKINTAKNLTVGAFNTIAGVGMLVEGFGPGLHRTIKGARTISSQMDSKTARMYRRTQTDENYYLGPIGSIYMKLDRDLEKDQKEIKKLNSKQDLLLQITRYEEEANIMIDELKQGLTEKEHEEMLKELKLTIRNTNKKIISGSKIQKAMNTYMYKKGIEKIKEFEESDFNGFLDELQNVLDESGKNTIKLDSNTRTNLRNRFTELSELNGLDVKKASALFEEKLSDKDVIAVGKLNNVTNPVAQDKLKTISDNLRKIYALNQQSVILNRGSAENYNKVLKELVKRFGEVK